MCTINFEMTKPVYNSS